jgi:hypothetical protein
VVGQANPGIALANAPEHIGHRDRLVPLREKLNGFFKVRDGLAELLAHQEGASRQSGLPDLEVGIVRHGTPLCAGRCSLSISLYADSAHPVLGVIIGSDHSDFSSAAGERSSQAIFDLPRSPGYTISPVIGSKTIPMDFFPGSC